MLRIPFLIIFCLTVAGCMAGEPVKPPPKPPYFLPKRFIDGRLIINPWRDTPKGPSYPYALYFDEEEEVYRVIRREDAPYVAPLKGAPETPPTNYVRPFLYETEKRHR